MGYSGRGRSENGFRRRREHRQVMLAMLVSAVVHLAASRIGWRVESPGNREGPTRSGDAWAALEVLNLKTPDAPPVADRRAFDTPAQEVTEAFTDRVEPAVPTPDPRPTVHPGPPSAATRLRASGPDPRLFGVPEEEALDPEKAQAVVSGIVADFLARPPEVRGRDSLKLTAWGEEGSSLRLQPGLLTIGGVGLPFCGGPDADRCGFGVRPWDLERADREAEFLRGLEEQGRWESIQARAREIRRRAHARRDTIPGL